MRLVGIHSRAMLPDAWFTHGSRRLVRRGWLGGALLALAITLSAHRCAACDVMLRWKGPANISGYRVYWGSASACTPPAAGCSCTDPAAKCYPTQTGPLGLLGGSTLDGVIYYFDQGMPSGAYVAVTAYNAAGESSPSNEGKIPDCSVAVPPQVNAGPDQFAPVGTSLTLGSMPQAGVSYFWEQTAGPPATLSSRTSSSTGFSAGSAGTFTFAVTAYNAQGVAARDSVSVTLTNTGAPTPNPTSRAPTPTSIPTPTAIKVGSSVLVRGNRRRPSTDRSGCQVEWMVVSSGNTVDQFGLPSLSQSCQDGDPSCDFQPQTPGRCEFHVRVCLNNADPNLPACTPSGIGTVAVSAPRPRAALGADAYAILTADAATLQNALEHLQNPRDAVAHSIYSPPLNPTQQGFCSGTFAIQALVSRNAHRPSVTLKTRSGNYATLRRQISVSQLQLTCSPAAQ